jgi:hypothetical protein
MSRFDYTILGEYTRSYDYALQEDVRRLTLIICSDTKQPLFFNGWATLFAIKVLLPMYQARGVMLKEKLVKLAEDCIKNAGPINLEKNIRADIKKFLMFPQESYPDWIELDTPFSGTSIDDLNTQFSGKPCILKIVEKKLYCVLPEIPTKFKNREIPHITVINSDKFDEKIHSKYEFDEVVDIKYTKLAATYSFDYPLFGDCVVARLESKQLTHILSEVGIKKSLCLTVYEEPKPDKIWIYEK